MKKTEYEKIFELEDIEDCRIIIKAKEDYYAIIPKKGMDKEEARILRIALGITLLESHAIIDTPLHELKDKMAK